MLKKLCEINPVNALNSWKGSLKEKCDFIFSNWAFEIKSTRKEGLIHTINGLDKLKPPSGKHLAMFSFLAAKSDDSISKSLQDLIEDIEKNLLMAKQT